MAKDFDVPFLGSVPIDPMFVSLIEEGKRPVYPQGTVVAGQDMAGNAEADKLDDGVTLAEKYKSCSLHPLFEGMVKQALANKLAT